MTSVTSQRPQQQATAIIRRLRPDDVVLLLESSETNNSHFNQLLHKYADKYTCAMSMQKDQNTVDLIMKRFNSWGGRFLLRCEGNKEEQNSVWYYKQMSPQEASFRTHRMLATIRMLKRKKTKVAAQQQQQQQKSSPPKKKAKLVDSPNQQQQGRGLTVSQRPPTGAVLGCGSVIPMMNNGGGMYPPPHQRTFFLQSVVFPFQNFPTLPPPFPLSRPPFMLPPHADASRSSVMASKMDNNKTRGPRPAGPQQKLRLETKKRKNIPLPPPKPKVDLQPPPLSLLLPSENSAKHFESNDEGCLSVKSQSDNVAGLESSPRAWTTPLLWVTPLTRTRRADRTPRRQDAIAANEQSEGQHQGWICYARGESK